MASERFMPAEGFFTTAAFYLLLYLLLKRLSQVWQRRLIFRPAGG
jgi:polar amino acid transport system permease protein